MSNMNYIPYRGFLKIENKTHPVLVVLKGYWNKFYRKKVPMTLICWLTTVFENGPVDTANGPMMSTKHATSTWAAHTGHIYNYMDAHKEMEEYLAWKTLETWDWTTSPPQEMLQAGDLIFITSRSEEAKFMS